MKRFAAISSSSSSSSSYSSSWSLGSFPSILILFLIISLLLPTSNASIGDKSPEYQSCTGSCYQDSCSPASNLNLPSIDDGTISPFNPSKLPFSLRITGWNCIDDCKYHCTHRITNDANQRVQKLKHRIRERIEDGIQIGEINPSQKDELVEKDLKEELKRMRKIEKQMVQYHGKWVFIRIAGAQEPFSVLFSFFNFYINFIYYFKMKSRISNKYPLKRIYVIHSLISMNSWIWSSVFHTRDKDLTEKLDYFSAGFNVLSSFFFTFNRVFFLNPNKNTLFKWFRLICILAGLGHVSYLSVGRFDYSYNMKANITVGILQSLLWLIYSLKSNLFFKSFGENDRSYRILNDEMKKDDERRRSTTTITTTTILDNSSSNHNNHSSSNTIKSSSRTSTSTPSLPSNLRNSLQFLLFLTILSTSFELFDFPPLLRLIDAHSLWHLSTVPLTYKWYEFLIKDSQNLVDSNLWIDEELRKKRDEAEKKRKEFWIGKRKEIKRFGIRVLKSRRVKQLTKVSKHQLERGKEWLEGKGVRLDWLENLISFIPTIRFGNGNEIRNQEEIELMEERGRDDDEITIPIENR